jgi:oxygen-dependent protoporphyrinogen oxidase
MGELSAGASGPASVSGLASTSGPRVDGPPGGPLVVVVGAGIAGLAAAYALRRDGPPGIRITVLDADRRLGGKLRVSAVGELAVDEGAEMFLVRVPEAAALAAAVGLGGGLAHPVTTAAGVVVGGRPRPLPAGTVLGVPADLAALRATGVLGADAVAAVAAEADRPGEPVVGDVAVGEYVRRRLGGQVVDRLVDPLLGGVYAGRADRLSLHATMPALARELAQPPATGQPAASLVAAARAVRAAEAGPPDRPVFATLPAGLGTLPAAVAAAAGADVRLGLPARRVDRVGHGFRVLAGPAPAPTVLLADAVVVAVPATKAAPLLAAVAPAAAAELAGVEYASMAIVTLGYRTARLDRPLAGSGLLVPAAAGGAVKAVTYSSAKWAHLAGRELTVLRASVGRHGEEQLLHRDDPDLVALVAAEVAGLTGLPVGPVASRVSRWGGALPQYAVGHVDRVARIRAGVAAVPGLAVCGAAYEGVGVPACIRSGYAAAAAVLAHLAQPAAPTGSAGG